jgi:DNA-binding XRE family transcriptional regulator
VETRRKEVGKAIKQARRILKIRSQAALADKVGVHESSVANAEIGSDRTGDTVFEAIEAHFGWPIGSSMDYISNGGTPPWERGEPAAPENEPPPYEWTAAARRKLIAMSLQEVMQLVEHTRLMRGDAEAERALRAITKLREEAGAIAAPSEAP